MRSTTAFYADPPPSNGKQVTHSEDVKKKEYKIELKWFNIIMLTYLHIAGIYGFFLSKMTSTLIIGWTYGILTGMGTTVGSHRLFTHRTFKANLPLKLILVFFQTAAGQEPIIRWARDHRVHHKFTDTDADPYNSRRGFFFSHVGWLLCKKHPDVIEQGKKVDMSDLEDDPVMQFQSKYFVPMTLFLNFCVPLFLVCWYGESFHVAWYGNIYRYALGLNLVWSVNSVAHLWGDKPYDKNISSTDTYLVGFCALGEGWHNYHHTFPWDYKTAELPGYSFNFSTAFIDFFAKIGWATDLKTVPEAIVQNRIFRTGDGSHSLVKNSKKSSKEGVEVESAPKRDVDHFWGFGDAEMTKEDMKNIKILHKTFN